MTELVSLADKLRNKAQAKKEKVAARLSGEQALSIVVNFLNDNGMEYLPLNDYMPTAKPSAIVAKFRNVVIENKLDDLVYPVEDEGIVYLSQLVPGSEDES